MSKNIIIKQKCNYWNRDYKIPAIPESLSKKLKRLKRSKIITKKLILEEELKEELGETEADNSSISIFKILTTDITDITDWATDWFDYFYNKIFYTFWNGYNDKKTIYFHSQPRFWALKVRRDACAPENGFYGFWNMGKWIEKDLSSFFKIKYVLGKWIILKRGEFSYMKYIKD